MNRVRPLQFEGLDPGALLALALIQRLTALGWPVFAAPAMHDERLAAVRSHDRVSLHVERASDCPRCAERHHVRDLHGLAFFAGGRLRLDEPAAQNRAHSQHDEPMLQSATAPRTNQGVYASSSSP